MCKSWLWRGQTRSLDGLHFRETTYWLQKAILHPLHDIGKASQPQHALRLYHEVHAQRLRTHTMWVDIMSWQVTTIIISVGCGIAIWFRCSPSSIRQGNDLIRVDDAVLEGQPSVY